MREPATTTRKLPISLPWSQIEKERNISKQLRLESESGGLRTLMLEIEDSVLAVGMKLIRLDEDGNPLSDVQVRPAGSRITCLQQYFGEIKNEVF